MRECEFCGLLARWLASSFETTMARKNCLVVTSEEELGKSPADHRGVRRGMAVARRALDCGGVCVSHRAQPETSSRLELLSSDEGTA